MDNGRLGVGGDAGVVAGVLGDSVGYHQAGGGLSAVVNGDSHASPLSVVVEKAVVVFPIHHMGRDGRLGGTQEEISS